ncbi:DUF4184 family protein [Massilia violaceinigra]|uniref:DUF4184 family protein n=1 Tax=Massilia violaceinigra TaxID=2045208 RepID=A0ABY4A236_9BURK|nr:DUF4184 family protein [Massilia violaceinigra]UOD28819.1 DUF4184 family protein [Massilia violaceinigra]
MPFTLCHPAIVIPLHRYARDATSLPALAIGSMMPDFVYFFAFGVSGPFSHSVTGIFLYCVPVGALVYLLYRALLRPAFLAFLPQAVSRRMAWHIPSPWHSIRAASALLASLAIGASTHIVWDTFTHPDTALVSRIELLRTLVPVGGYRVPVFKILQHTSSLVGLIAIAACTLVWYSRSTPGPPYQPSFSNRQRLLAVAGVVTATLAGGTWGLLFRSMRSTEHALFNMVTSGMAAGAIGMVLVCAWWKALALTRKREK